MQVLYLQQELAKQQTLEQQRFKQALEKQRLEAQLAASEKARLKTYSILKSLDDPFSYFLSLVPGKGTLGLKISNHCCIFRSFILCLS